MPFIAPDCPLHQVFKANSAILNTLLTLLNERLFDDGATRECVPLLSAVAASNEGASSDGLPHQSDCPLISLMASNEGASSDGLLMAFLMTSLIASLIAPLIALQLASDGLYLPLIAP